MRLYRFSPIQNEKQLLEAASYIATNTSELAERVIGQKLPITYLTIFAHYPDEFENLTKILQALGAFSGENNGPRVALHKPIRTGSNAITHLRIRKPDPYRMQVGCSDFNVSDYNAFKNEHLSRRPNNLRLIKRDNYEMIEFFDPDYDVLAYVLSK